ncbi:MAG: DUF6526 family protein [Thermoanaerobaculia bacterium]
MSDPNPQTFANHTRWDPIFHFFALPVLLLLFPIYSIVHLVRHPTPQSGVILVVAVALAVNTFRTRTYPLSVQDRLIALEERLRIEKLLSGAPKDYASRLTDDQLIGLRFASDDELAGLVSAAASEKLARREIKKRVQVWRADHRRA